METCNLNPAISQVSPNFEEPGRLYLRFLRHCRKSLFCLGSFVYRRIVAMMISAWLSRTLRHGRQYLRHMALAEEGLGNYRL